MVGAALHDPRVGVGEVVLVVVARPRRRRGGRATARRTAGAARLGRALLDLRGVDRLLRRVAFVGAGGLHRLRLGQACQPLLPPGELIGDDQAVRQRALVRLRAQREQRLDLGAQAAFQFAQPLVADLYWLPSSSARYRAWFVPVSCSFRMSSLTARHTSGARTEARRGPSATAAILMVLDLDAVPITSGAETLFASVRSPQRRPHARPELPIHIPTATLRRSYCAPAHLP